MCVSHMSSVYFDQTVRYVPHMITSHDAALAPGYLQDIHLQPEALERVLAAGLTRTSGRSWTEPGSSIGSS